MKREKTLLNIIRRTLLSFFVISYHAKNIYFQLPLLFNIIRINGDKMGRAGYQIISQKQQDDFQNNYTYAIFQTAG